MSLAFWAAVVGGALGRQRKADLCEFQGSLVYKASFRTAKVAQRDPALKEQKKRKMHLAEWVTVPNAISSAVYFLDTVFSAGAPVKSACPWSCLWAQHTVGESGIQGQPWVHSDFKTHLSYRKASLKKEMKTERFSVCVCVCYRWSVLYNIKYLANI